MSKDNGGRGGSVINISSYAGMQLSFKPDMWSYLLLITKVCSQNRYLQCTVQPKQVLLHSLKHYV